MFQVFIKSRYEYPTGPVFRWLVSQIEAMIWKANTIPEVNQKQ